MASPASSPDEAHSTLESGTVTDGFKSVDVANPHSNGDGIDLPTRIHTASRYDSLVKGLKVKLLFGELVSD